MSLFGPPSPKHYRELRRALRDFRNPYVEYMNRIMSNVYEGGHVTRGSERSELLRKAVLAGHAVNRTGIRVAWLPPAVMNAPPLEGLANVAFAHENPLYWEPDEGLYLRGSPRPFDLVVDALDSADVILEERQREAERLRKSPFYWGDRVLRAILGFPAYLVSLILGFDRRALSTTSARALWWLSLAADAAGIYGFGMLVEWWG